MPEHEAIRANQQTARNLNQSAERSNENETASPGLEAQRGLDHPQSMSPQSVMQMQRSAGNRAVAKLMAQSTQPTNRNQPQNRTGLPDRLKQGIESLSGFTMDDVKVHYNSEKPAQMEADAYTQGTNIHIGPGQEQHLPHEAWHVVQQKSGSVRPTIQMKGTGVNDDETLEREASHMGQRALMVSPATQVSSQNTTQISLESNSQSQASKPVQFGRGKHKRMKAKRPQHDQPELIQRMGQDDAQPIGVQWWGAGARQAGDNFTAAQNDQHQGWCSGWARVSALHPEVDLLSGWNAMQAEHEGRTGDVTMSGKDNAIRATKLAYGIHDRVSQLDLVQGENWKDSGKITKQQIASQVKGLQPGSSLMLSTANHYMNVKCRQDDREEGKKRHQKRWYEVVETEESGVTRQDTAEAAAEVIMQYVENNHDPITQHRIVSS
ncbi:MAG: DUF4157 domain-containing protein [Solirubrobacterales bacterium]